jgi:hypothetical protein
MGAVARLLVSFAAALMLGGPTSAGNKLAAQRDAQRLLSLVVLPPGAERLAVSPTGLQSAFSIPGTQALVDKHRLWRVPESLARVVAFEHAHPPRGSRLSQRSAGTGMRGLGFTLPARAGRLSSRNLLVSMASIGGGWTGLRADAQVVWVAARPQNEVVPASVREIDVRRLHGASRSVTDPRKVTRIIRWFDALPIVQPNTYYCPAMLGPRVIATFAFRDASGALLARARSPGSAACGSAIDFSIGGRPQTPLLGRHFLVRVGRLIGLRLAPTFR